LIITMFSLWCRKPQDNQSWQSDRHSNRRFCFRHAVCCRPITTD